MLHIHLALLIGAAAMPAQDKVSSLEDAGSLPVFVCGSRPMDVAEEYERAVRVGLVPDPEDLPSLAQASTPPLSASAGCLTTSQMFVWEDTDQDLLANLSTAQLIAVMVDAANQLIAQHGDAFDFIGYFLNFDSPSQIGAAFYLPIFNDVAGIGDVTGNGTPLFDNRAAIGLASSEVQGFVMMWDVNDWAGGAGTPLADLTRLVVQHEFGHRFACYLPPFNDGRAMQGSGACGSSGHWNGQVDAQGSCLFIGEWTGANPATGSNQIQYNKDVAGGAHSYFELYLMGYVPPAELDTAPSELRFVADPYCSSRSFATVSHFTSIDVVASAGTRVPTAPNAQKDFRSAWIMIHEPGDVPDVNELTIATGILEQNQLDWPVSTLGRGTMNHALFDDCDCNGIADATDLAGGAPDLNGNGVLDACETIDFVYCTPKINSDGCSPSIAFAGTPSLSLASSFDVSATNARANAASLLFYGVSGPTSAPFLGGTLCASPPLRRTSVQTSRGTGLCGGTLAFDFNAWLQSGSPTFVSAGSAVHAQFWYVDTGDPFGVGLSDAIEFWVRP